MGALVAAARAGDPRGVARLISLVEKGSPLLRDVMAALAPDTGGAQVIGLTGPPGVGKSTLTSALVERLRAAGRRVGVLAVDPSSPFSGGALLGDRVRMVEHALDEGVYIRSMAARGHLGGLAATTPQALRVLEAAGCEVVLIETVGVGQSELEVAALADTTVVLLAPGHGDAIQASKAGILEVADVVVVNKADLGGSEQVTRDMSSALALRAHDPGQWRVPVVSASALHGEGGDAVLDAVAAHRSWLVGSGTLERRRRRRAREEVEALAVAALRERWSLGSPGAFAGPALLDELAARVAAGRADPYAAADELLAGRDEPRR